MVWLHAVQSGNRKVIWAHVGLSSFVIFIGTIISTFFLTRCFLFAFSCRSLDRKAPAPALPTEAEPGSEAAPPPPHAPPPHQPPPLPHRPPPPPPSNYIMSTTSSYMSGEGYQNLQSMMKTEGPSYAPMPPSYAPPIPQYHQHVYPPPAAPPPGPPPPPSTYPPPSLAPTYPPPGYNSYPPPPPPRMPPGHVPPGIGLPPTGYPPPPPVPPGQSQVPLPLPPGMPLNRGGMDEMRVWYVYELRLGRKRSLRTTGNWCYSGTKQNKQFHLHQNSW